jgi:hypothetical protein
MRDRGVLIVLFLMCTAMLIVVGFLWYLATESTALTDCIDPQPNIEGEAQ